MDALFSSVCAGLSDFAQLPLDRHILLSSSDFVAGGAPAVSTHLAVSGTAFLIVRNACSGPIHVSLRQSIEYRVRLRARDLSAGACALALAAVIAAGAIAACAVSTLSQVRSC